MTIIEITNLDSKTTFSIEIADEKTEFYKRCIADLYGDYLYCPITDINNNIAYISKQMIQKNLIVFRTVSEDVYFIEKLNKKLKEEREKVTEIFNNGSQEQISDFVKEIFPHIEKLKDENR